MNIGCKPVVFSNSDGLKLFGILHYPDSQTSKSTPIILLSPGVKYRVAPHRLYIKLARHLTAMGFIVLRFDFSGLGDSEGIVKETTVADFYGTVQMGRYVNDTKAAMDWMQQEFNASRFILAGLCGGAITGLLAGAQDQRVDSLIGLGLPVILDSQHVDHTQYLTTGELKQWREGYLSKFFDFKSWLRLLTFKSNYRVILKIILSLPMGKRIIIPQKPVLSSGSNQTTNFNPLIPSAFERLISTRNALLIFSENDRLYSIYQERFADPYHAILNKYRENYEIYIVKQANHIFSFPEWQQDLFYQLASWLDRHY